MCSSQLLLMVEVNDNESSYAIPGKLFDYIYSKRPIMAIGPNKSEVKNILLETKSGRFFNYDELLLLKSHLQNLYKEFEEGQIRPNNGDVNSYSRKILTNKLSKLIKDVCFT